MVDIRVLRGIHRAVRRNDTNRAAIGVEHRLFGRAALAGVEMGKTAGGEHPKRLVLVGHLADTAQVHHALVGDGIVAAMAGVVEIERAVLEQVVQLVLGQRVALAGGIGLLRVRIEIDLVDNKVGVLATHALRTGFRHACMEVVVAIVGQENELLLPSTRIGVLNIGDELVYHRECFGLRGNRKASDTDIHTALRVAFTLVVVEKSEIVVGGVSSRLDRGVLGLIGEQRVLTRGGQELAVVERAIAHQTEPTRLAVAARAAVVEHLHQPTIGCGVRRAAGELVINLLVGNNRPRDGFFLLVRLRQASGLGNQKIGADDNVIDISEGVQILVADTSDHGGGKPTAAIGIDGNVFLYLRLVAALES